MAVIQLAMSCSELHFIRSCAPETDWKIRASESKVVKRDVLIFHF